MTEVKVLIVEDDRLVTDFYSMIFNNLNARNLGLCFNYVICKSSKSIKKQIAISKKGTKDFDLLLLDIRLKDRVNKAVEDGEVLGKDLKKIYPSLKIIVITMIESQYRFQSIFKNLQPEGFLFKFDLGALEFEKSILTVLGNKTYYCDRASLYLRNKAVLDMSLDDIDRKLLYCLSQGVMNKDLKEYIPLSMSGIEKRKRNISYKFGLEDAKASSLIKAAKRHGYI